MTTPNASRYYAAVRAEFPEIDDGGIFNCRPIAGTDVWSQHAFGNADDQMTTSKTLHGRIADWLMETVTTTGGYMRRYQALGVRTCLTWGRSLLTGNAVTGHKDHVHTDFWPRGSFTPPCAGGTLRVIYPNGTTGASFRLYPNVTIIPKESIVKTTYRTVKNVPAGSDGKPLDWAKNVVDWGIQTGLINISDSHPDDWDEVLSSGRYWSFEYRRR